MSRELDTQSSAAVPSPRRPVEVVMSERDYEALSRHLLVDPRVEAHAFLLAGMCEGTHRTRLLVREVVPAQAADYITQSAIELELQPSYFLPIIDRCRQEGLSLIEAHSHPRASTNVTFSALDVANEKEKFPWYERQIPGARVATLVFGQESVDGHYWDPAHGQVRAVDALRVVGRRLRVLGTTSGAPGEELVGRQNSIFDRQERLLGQEGQRRIAGCRVGIVGCGGIGSLVVQQLAYLGVRQFVLVDMDVVETTNLNRLVGATALDAYLGIHKVDVMQRVIESVSRQAHIEVQTVSVASCQAEEALKDVDLLVGASDSDGARVVMNEVAVRYLIPYIDLGAGVNTENGCVEDAGGQFWMVVPGGFCLQCTGLIDAARARVDLMTDVERRRHEARGYGTNSPQPAVIFLNATIAALAVGEMVKYLTGLTEAAPMLHYDALRPSVQPLVPMSPDPGCVVCRRDASYALGDQERIGARRRQIPLSPSCGSHQTEEVADHVGG